MPFQQTRFRGSGPNDPGRLRTKSAGCTKHSTRMEKRGQDQLHGVERSIPCPECSGEVEFLDETLDEDTKGTKKEFDCPHCATKLTRRLLERKFCRRQQIRGTGLTIRSPTRKPVIINYSSETEDRLKKSPIWLTLKGSTRLKGMTLPLTLPLDWDDARLPLEQERWGRRMAFRGGCIHPCPSPLSALAPPYRLPAYGDRATKTKDKGLRSALLFFVEQAVWSMSLLNRYRPTGLFSSKPIYVWSELGFCLSYYRMSVLGIS